eukprot:Nitzschia sp. Nitz4//scaffold53_size117307//38708//39930//NITZ4_003764-RA/size117307-augustus-gene-0.92-mRNA-1//1//CDS//3329554187//462//frame0
MRVVPHIIVAGGGIMGNSIAYHLAQRNVPCTIVDPVGIAPGASSKAGGFLARDWRDGTPLQALHRLGFDLHEELARELGTTNVDYRRLTCAAVAVDETKMVAKPTNRKLQGVEWVDQGVTGSADMGDERTIAQVHPRKLCEQLWAQTTQKVGSKLHIGRVTKAILDTDSGNNAIKGVQLEDGSVLEATHLVVACGPWSHEAQSWFSDAVNVPDTLPLVTSVKCHSILVQNPTRVLNQAVFFESPGVLGRAHLEVYPRPDGDCYVNGFQGEEGIIQERPGQEEVEADRVHVLQAALQQTASELKGLDAHTKQACYWPETPDGLPMIGEIPGISGAFVATGHSVWGILQGPATGKVVSELLLDGKASSVDISPFRVQRFH